MTLYIDTHYHTVRAHQSDCAQRIDYCGIHCQRRNVHIELLKHIKQLPYGTISETFIFANNRCGKPTELKPEHPLQYAHPWYRTEYYLQ